MGFCVPYKFSYLFFFILERAKALHKQTKGQRGCFKAKKRGHVLLQIPKTRCAVGPLYCQHVWMPCSINFSLNSLTRIYETCNMGLQLFWSLHTCSTRCRLHSHFKAGRGKKAEIGRSWRVASCSVKSFKCIYTLLCLLGTVFYTLMRLRSKFRSVIPGIDARVAGIPLTLSLFSLPFPLSSPVQIINKRKYIIPFSIREPRAGLPKLTQSNLR